MKYGVISIVLRISTHLQLVTILMLLVKYLVIFYVVDLCNKSYVYIMVTTARLMQTIKLLQFDLLTHSLDNFLISLI